MKQCPTCGKRYEDTNTLCPADGTVLKRNGDALVGQLLAGKYRIEEKIDEGGMGAVYRATHILMEKTLAIKVLHPSLAADDKIVARFTREAKAASRISHPHALTVTDFGESENGVVFLVMEYLRGHTLKDVIRKEGRMPLGRAVEIVRQVCGALDAAHAEGVVHRDLKSDNIMLEETAGGDWAKVLDFGIAKIKEPVNGQDPGLTAPNLIIGTPQYMSPEQCAQASEIDSRSDIYSLGVILYDILVCHVPYTGDSPTAIMMKHLQEPAPSVLDERRDLPAAVGRVVARSLAKRPEDRYQTAGALAEDLALAATTELVPAAVATPTAEQHTDTNRIVVPTGPNDAPRQTTAVEADEATVVSRRAATPRRAPVETQEVVPSFVEPPPPDSGFSPWHIALPAVALLAVVFAAFFVFQRGGSSSTQGQPTTPATSDANSQPVQSVAPPTGQAETHLVPASATPAPTPVIVETGAAGTVPTAEPNAASNSAPNSNGARDAQGRTADERNKGRNAEQGADQNADRNAGDNTGDAAAPEATPTPASHKNGEKRAAPPPPVNPGDDDDDVPPPPKQKASPQQKNPPPPVNAPPTADDKPPLDAPPF